jgi:hypothetical protein
VPSQTNKAGNKLKPFSKQRARSKRSWDAAMLEESQDAQLEASRSKESKLSFEEPNGKDGSCQKVRLFHPCVHDPD